MSEDKTVGGLLTAITGLGWAVTFENRDESRSVSVRFQKDVKMFQVMAGREDLERSRGDADRVLAYILRHAEVAIADVESGRAVLKQ